jgi:transposase
MTKKRKTYSKQFKIDAVKLLTEQGYQITEAARNLGIHPGLLGRWKKQFETDNADSFPGKGHMTPEKEELHRLRKENKQLKMEREILKKAAAFFANESK